MLIPPRHSKTNLSNTDYETIRTESLQNPNDFWAKQARRLIDWHQDFTIVNNSHFTPDNVSIKWFEDGKLNACYNAIDRHLPALADKTAIFWESDCGTQSKKFTYQDLYNKVNKTACKLLKMGVRTGDVVVIYLPMIPEAIFTMLACSRIGAIHCVVFAGFSAEALRGRIEAAGAKYIVTATVSKRAGKTIPLKENVDKAIDALKVNHVLVVDNGHLNTTPMVQGRDLVYHNYTTEQTHTDCVFVGSEHPLFILYTSGSTGTPKGLVHTTGGYCVYTAYTYQLVFNHHPDDVFFCTADIGWITGHSYLTYAPLMSGTSLVMFEGVPTYPHIGRFWEICEKYKVTSFYTAPTALRSLMAFGDAPIIQYDLSNLRVLGSVGEPINPEVWEWYDRVVGKHRCNIVDTWWQTETGGFLISAVAGTTPMQAGYAGKPLPGINIRFAESGEMIIASSWPSQARTIWGDHTRFMDTYFKAYPHHYATGDGAKQDEQGYILVTGRLDDVLNVSGHRLGTSEIESALVCHDAVAEAAVVGYPHTIKGEGIYAYVRLMEGTVHTEALLQELKQKVREKIGAIATPDMIHLTSDLPKTRSGKIMRRILRKIAVNDTAELGDISTLANPDSVQSLMTSHHKKTK